MRVLDGEQQLVRVFIGESDRWHEGLVTLEKVRVLKYAAGPPRS